MLHNFFNFYLRREKRRLSFKQARIPLHHQSLLSCFDSHNAKVNYGANLTYATILGGPLKNQT